MKSNSNCDIKRLYSFSFNRQYWSQNAFAENLSITMKIEICMDCKKLLEHGVMKNSYVQLMKKVLRNVNLNILNYQEHSLNDFFWVKYFKRKFFRHPVCLKQFNFEIWMDCIGFPYIIVNILLPRFLLKCHKFWFCIELLV